jgi:hypothetical protein
LAVFYHLVTDQTNKKRSTTLSGSVRSGLVNNTSTFTFPGSKIWPSQRLCQLSGEWQKLTLPIEFILVPFTGRPPCDPNMTDPGSGDNKAANARAILNCFSSLNRWKNDDAWMAETYPRSGLSDDNVFKAGIAVFGVSLKGLTGSRINGSKTSPVINGTGNVSAVDLKSSCPRSQNSVRSVDEARTYDATGFPYALVWISDASTPSIGNPSAIIFLVSLPTNLRHELIEYVP